MGGPDLEARVWLEERAPDLAGEPLAIMLARHFPTMTWTTAVALSVKYGQRQRECRDGAHD